MPSKPRRWILPIAVVVAVAFVTAAAVSVWAHGARGFSARAQPTEVERWLAGAMRAMALPGRAVRLKNPDPRLTPAQMQFASEHFAAHCAVCHDNNGDGKIMLGQNMYPHPPDLRGPGTQDMSSGALYYTIRNGIRMSGMPAWGDDTPEETWELVDFIRHLPRITQRQLQRMRRFDPKTIFPEPIMGK